jgi:hypothetical protein
VVETIGGDQQEIRRVGRRTLAAQGIAKNRMKAPNPKQQITNKFQSPKPEIKSVWSFEIGIWSLFGIWSL